VKRNHVLMVVGLIVSAGLAIFGDKTPGGEQVSEPAARPGSAATATPAARTATTARPSDKRKRPITILALQPRATLIGRNDAQSAAGLFAHQTNVPPPPPPAAKVAAAPPPAPTLPPLPFVYLGKKYENAKWEVYLSIGDQTYFVREGSVVEKNYMIKEIKPPTMTITFIPMKQVQTLAVGEAD
jgi:hypothetical protein